VVHVVHTLVIFEGKTEIGICSLFQIYDPSGLLFEFAYSTSERVQNFAPPAATGDERPFFVPSIMDE
jgi:hypothetical protein